SELGKDDRQVRREVAAAIASSRAHDGKHLAIVIEPAQQQLRTQGPQCLDLLAEWMVRGDELRTEVRVSHPQVGILELLRKGRVDVGLRYELQLDACFAETDALFLLQAKRTL